MTDRPSADARPLQRARLTIDVAAIVANWQALREMAAPALTAAVVKADAYGLGVAEIAPALRAAGCATFFVARVEEGVGLRRLVGDARIFVLDGIAAGGAEECAAFDLVPVLNHPGDLAHWAECGVRLGRVLPAALHVDTGLIRLGFTAADALALGPADLAGIDLRLVMSHLACADEIGHPFNALQLERFRVIRQHLGGVPGSLAASSAMFLGDAYRQDLCRPGIALYGGSPLAPDRPNPMRPVVTLEAPVLQVYQVDAPGTVGYGATYPIWPGMRIATLAVGYADGFPRAASGRATVRIGGQEVPVAGRVSMDLMSIDVSSLPPDAVTPGTRVELIGALSGVDPLATAGGTIAYEILTRLGRRFERHYLKATT